MIFAAIVATAVPLGNIATAQTSNQPAVLGGGGRYVFGQINEYNADQYMLDTATGRLWRLVDTADGVNSVLEMVPYALPDGRSQQLPTDQASQPVPPPVPALLSPPEPLIEEN
jgi:Tol biopolymer transport system component